jgi:superfamily II DNA helicase RecQ
MSVATTAFGMNVVQPDVRFMLHTNISDRLTLPGDRPSRP